MLYILSGINRVKGSGTLVIRLYKVMIKSWDTAGCSPNMVHYCSVRMWQIIPHANYRFIL